ncbi:MAG: GNAT family N-acetyltransferase [Chloroflexi bacterium]|nr:GNAT family N-acetyltransferase [Chloroflexota bacterium]
MQIVHQLDPVCWKSFVDANPDGNIFHTPEMFEVFSRAKGHQPELWACLGDDGEICALLPVVRLTMLDGLFKAMTTRRVAYGSVLCAPNEQGRAALATLLEAYKREAGSSALFTELRNLSDLGILNPTLNESGFVYEDHLNFLIDLTLPQETIWRKISRRKRERINSSRGKGTTIEPVTGPEKLEIAYRFLQEVYARVQIPLADQSLFQAAFDILGPRGMFQVLLARVGEQYAATIFLLSYHGRVLYWYVGADRALSTYSPSEFLVWHALEWSKAQGYQVFDFGGGGKPGQEYGPREFKSRFGGVQVNYGRHLCVHAPMRLKLSQVGYQVYRRVSAPRHANS